MCDERERYVRMEVEQQHRTYDSMRHEKERKKRPYADRSHRLVMSALSSGGGVAYVIVVYMSCRASRSDAIGRRPRRWRREGSGQP
ncbi:uncharacterized protein SCHCODRAFT_02613034 [Schizophyllum commune H4-8]|uniref:uncharacterized protein n=1 Tax=Schizophyllum commune (strain H4-8 / FGSC 9210) TaxID=578458 RepID=UPI0021606750|nr:uncharacterized protein SCHCODRAFT_02613034 [Schizophyllum commune H4-8]KAI5898741.1 hypothetical protein SCHCODRAFT_02613034 [Schizophyllum commune H4-8]